MLARIQGRDVPCCSSFFSLSLLARFLPTNSEYGFMEDTMSLVHSSDATIGQTSRTPALPSPVRQGTTSESMPVS